MPTAGHPGRDRTLGVASTVYYWPTMRVDINRYAAQCISFAKHKGTTKGPAPMPQYPPPVCPWDVVSIDLLQLPTSCLGSQYLLLCVDNFSRFVVLVPVKNKTAVSVAHALVTQLICPYRPLPLLTTQCQIAWSNEPIEKFSTYCVQ